MNEAEYLMKNRPLALRGHVTNASFKQWQKGLVGHILNKKNSHLAFQTRTIILK